MQTGLPAVGWGASRLAIGLGVAAFGALLAYVILVFVFVAIQVTAALGQ